MPKKEVEKKALSFGSVGELNKISQDVKLNLNNAFQCKQYCKAANDIFRKAENLYKCHDEEQAYMLFMRYFHIIQSIKKSYEFVKSKNTYLPILNECSVESAITKAEELSASLHSRYKKRDEELIEKQLLEKKKSLEKANLKKSVQNGTIAPKSGTSDGLHLPEVPNGFVPKSDANGISSDSGDSSKPEVVADPPSLFPTKGFISVTELYALLKDFKNKPDALMIIDIRPVEEFNASHVSHNCIINVPENLLQFGANINSIERKLSKQTWEIWSTRFKKEILVIMNYEFENPNAISTSLVLLQNVLCKFEATYQVLALIGGFKKWILHYPPMTTNPFYSMKPTMPTLLDSTALLKDLTYPELPSDERKRNEQSLQPSNQSIIESKVPLPQQNITGLPTSLNKGTENKGASKDLAADINMNDSNRPSNPSTKRNEVTSATNTSGLSQSLSSNLPQSIKTAISTIPSVSSLDVITSTTDTKPVINQNDGNLKTLAKKNSLIDSRDNTESMKNDHIESRTDTHVPTTSPASSVIGSIAAPVNSLKNNLTTTLPANISNNVSAIITSPSVTPQKTSVSNHPSSSNLSTSTIPSNISQPSVVVGTTTTTIVANDLSTVKPVNTLPSATKITSSIVSNVSTSIVSNVPSVSVNNVPSSTSPGLPTLASNITPSLVPNVSSPLVPDDTPTMASMIPPSNLTNSPAIVANVSPSIIPSVASSVNERNVSPIVPNNTLTSVATSNTIPMTSSHVNKNITLPTSDIASQPGMLGMQVHSDSSAANIPKTIPQNNIVPGMSGLNVSQNNIPNAPVISSGGKPAVTNFSSGMPQISNPQSLAKGNNHVKPMTLPPNIPVQSNQTMQQPPMKNNANSRKFTTTFGLPNGWEKAVSHETGRIYYKDHNTQTTHWTLPPEILAQVHKNETRHIEDKPVKPPPQVSLPEENKPSMKRSLSSPNLADLLNHDTEDVPKEKMVSAKPVIDRSVKPKEQKQVLVDRTKKPISASRLHKLSPVYGSLGHALTGLKNLGNTCYMNSVIQCLSNTTPLSKYFTSGLYEQDLNTQNMNSRPGEIARELSFVIIVLSAGQYRSVSPVDFKHALGRFSSQFNGCQQQDSHELLMFLLDGLHEDINRVKFRQTIKEKNNDSLPDHESADQAWSDYLLNNDSIIVKLFQGQFRSTVVCLFCGQKSKTFDAFNCLQLELPSNKSATLEDCISSFTKAEKIGGNDSWKCSKCKCYREASKTIEVWKLPPVLIIQLKRFRCDGRWRNKIQSAINFPMRNLNMTNHIRAPESEYSKYHLYGVINHYGSFESGHYTAYCENVHKGKWYSFDDNVVKELDTGTIKTNAAYLLFYTAVDFKDYLS